MLDKEKRAEILARCNAATDGPWTARVVTYGCNDRDASWLCDRKCAMCGHRNEMRGGWEVEGPQAVYEVAEAVEFGGCSNLAQSDAEFIAHAREDVPALLSALDAMENTLLGVEVWPCEKCVDYTNTADCPLCNSPEAAFAKLIAARYPITCKGVVGLLARINAGAFFDWCPSCGNPLYADGQGDKRCARCGWPGGAL